jgi:hypothetical protein
MLDWLAAPIDPARIHDVGVQLSWHGRLMVAAWLGLVPGGIMAARFFKVVPWQRWPDQLDNKTWWHVHRTCQYGATLASLAALWLMMISPQRHGDATWHAWFGWTVVAVTILQLCSAWLRGSKGGPTAPAADGDLSGDHYDMTRRRVAFEYFHKFAGYLTFTAANAAIATGLWRANAPQWMWIAIGCWLVLLVVSFTVLHRRGLALDTYQAIWGPGDEHPGNHRKPIGVAVIRRKRNNDLGKEPADDR